MYEFKTRVRYSEVDSAGKLTITGIVNYLQDIATFHSNDVGFSIDKLKEIHRAWLLSSWDIYIHRLPKYCEEIKVCTSPHTFKGLLAARNLWIEDASGEKIVEADSWWFYLDTEKGRPTRITEADYGPFGEPKRVLDIPDKGRKVEIPEGLAMTPAAPVEVQLHHIDTNRHMNNAQYIQVAFDALAETSGATEAAGAVGVKTSSADGDADVANAGTSGLAELQIVPGQTNPEGGQNLKSFHSGEIRVEYHKSALFGDIITPYIGKTPGGEVYISLKADDGTIYANLSVTPLI